MCVCVLACVYVCQALHYHANRKQSETHHWLPNSGSVQSTVSKPFLFCPSTPHFSFQTSLFLTLLLHFFRHHNKKSRLKTTVSHCIGIANFPQHIYVGCIYKVNHFCKRTKLMRQLLIGAIWNCVNSIDCNADGIRYCWRAPMTYIARTRQWLNRITAQ